jgi:hypothetical protein
MKDEMLMFKKNALLGNISAEPLCQAYKQAWRMCGDDKEMLVRLALMQQSQHYFSTACYKNLGLTKDYIKENFADYINGHILNDCDGVRGYTYSLYVDWDYVNDLDVKTDVCSVMWTVGANIVIPKTKCPTIYISNKSNVHIVCEGFNTINIKLFDESKVTVQEVDENSDVIIYKYSDKASVELGKFCLKEPKVFNKELRL